MHELSHITTGPEHSQAFHDQLHELLMVYNGATGANLANDMFGQQMRCDSRPYVLPDNIQVQQSRKGCTFRTEAKEQPGNQPRGPQAAPGRFLLQG